MAGRRPPRRPARGALLLTPGASATRDHAGLVAVDEALAGTGVVVERIDVAGMGTGAARIVRHIGEEAAALAERAGVAPDRVVLGGRSFGGRMCSVAVAEGLPAAGLALLSYPLHPPGRPDRLRTEHFGRLGVPCLFVSGTRDAFGTPGELEAATTAIPGPVEHGWVDGGDHGMRRHGERCTELVCSWVLTTLGAG